MIDCANGAVRDALPDYMHDRLAPADRDRVEAHLVECELCREELALLRDMRGALRHAPSFDVARIAAAVAPYRPSVAARGRPRVGRVAALLAAAAIGAVSVVRLMSVRSSEHPASGTVAVAPSVTAPASVSESLPADLSVGDPPPDSLPRAAVPRSSRSTPNLTPAGGQELAMAVGVIGDLSDRELSALLDDVESLDAVPSVEVERADPLSNALLGGER